MKTFFQFLAEAVRNLSDRLDQAIQKGRCQHQNPQTQPGTKFNPLAFIQSGERLCPNCQRDVSALKQEGEQ